jgi:hypothetical protein
MSDAKQERKRLKTGPAILRLIATGSRAHRLRFKRRMRFFAHLALISVDSNERG